MAFPGKSLFDRIRGKTFTPPAVIQLTSNPASYFSTYFPQIFGGTSSCDTKTINGQVNAYLSCAPLASIISKENGFLNNGCWKLLDSKGNELTKTNATPLQSILIRPNPLQGWDDFITHVYTYLKVFGRSYALPLSPEGLPGSKYAQALWIVPNWIITEQYTGKMYSQFEIGQIIEGYRIEGISELIKPEDILVFQDSQASMTQTPGYYLHAQSRLYSLQNPVANIIASYEARNTLIKRKGAIGILTNESKDGIGSRIPMSDDEINNVQADFQKYGMSRDQFPVIISSQALKWQPMTFNVGDLKLLEGNEADVLQLCDSFDWPPYLMGVGKAGTFNNVSEAHKYVYQNTIIPDAERISSVLSNYFKLKSLNISLKVTYDHLPVFQKSKKDEADAINIWAGAIDKLYKAGTITQEESRDLLSQFIAGSYVFDPTKPIGLTYYTINATTTII